MCARPRPHADDVLTMCTCPAAHLGVLVGVGMAWQNAEFIIELAGRAKTQIEGALRRPSPPLSSMLTSLDKKWAASSDNSTV